MIRTVLTGITLLPGRSSTSMTLAAAAAPPSHAGSELPDGYRNRGQQDQERQHERTVPSGDKERDYGGGDEAEVGIASINGMKTVSTAIRISGSHNQGR